MKSNVNTEAEPKIVSYLHKKDINHKISKVAIIYMKKYKNITDYDRREHQTHLLCTFFVYCYENAENVLLIVK